MTSVVMLCHAIVFSLSFSHLFSRSLSGGSLEVIRGNEYDDDGHSNLQQPVNLESFGHIFLRPFHTHKNNDDDRNELEGSGSSVANNHQYGQWSPSLSGCLTSPTGASVGAGAGGNTGVGNPASPSGSTAPISVSARERSSGLHIQEEYLQGYQLDGATLEHLIAARCTEGFRVMKISDERSSGGGGGGGGLLSEERGKARGLRAGEG